MMMTLLTVMVACATAQAGGGDALRDAMASRLAGDPPVVVAGRDGWLFLRGELRHVSVGEFWGDAAAKVSRASRPDAADPLPAIVDFKRQLDALGVELIMMPVPPKVVVYPDMLDEGLSPTPRGDAALQLFYGQLREQGVTVLDITEALLALREREPAYCRTDTHWSGTACVEAAKLVAAAVQDRPWLPEARAAVAHAWRDATISGDLGAMSGSPQSETLRLRFVGRAEADELTPIPPDKASPVVLLGDSHTLVFHLGGDMHATGAGLADQLAVELGLPVDLVGVRGSGATPARINLARSARSDTNYMSSKKLVIWCFSAREFTESTGWTKVPLTR